MPVQMIAFMHYAARKQTLRLVFNKAAVTIIGANHNMVRADNITRYPGELQTTFKINLLYLIADDNGIDGFN